MYLEDASAGAWPRTARRSGVTTSRVLPTYVQREFEDYLACRRLEHGFLRVRCEDYHDEKLVVFSCKHCGATWHQNLFNCKVPYADAWKKHSVGSTY
jgi:hypothetical protein